MLGIGAEVAVRRTGEIAKIRKRLLHVPHVLAGHASFERAIAFCGGGGRRRGGRRMGRNRCRRRFGRGRFGDQRLAAVAELRAEGRIDRGRRRDGGDRRMGWDGRCGGRRLVGMQLLKGGLNHELGEPGKERDNGGKHQSRGNDAQQGASLLPAPFAPFG